MRVPPPTDVAEGTVPPVAGAVVNATVASEEAGALAAPHTDAVGKTVPTAADAAPADDAGASATPFDDTAGKTRVSVTASAACAAAASVTAVGADCCGPSDWENIGISIDSWDFFKDAQGFGRLDTGSRAGFTSSRPPPPWTSVFQFSYFCTMCGLEKLGLVDQNWLERYFSVFLLRTLVVGRRQYSESIEVAFDME